MPGRLVGETVDVARPARLRADARDPRAAHPPRARDLEHLHQPRPLRRPGRRLPLAARPSRPRGASPSATCAAPTRSPRACRGVGTPALRRAVLQRVRAARSRRAPPLAARARARASSPACRSATGIPSSRTRCSSARPSCTTQAAMDRLVAALAAATRRRHRCAPERARDRAGRRAARRASCPSR